MKYLALSLFLLVAACSNPQVVTTQRQVVVIPDESMFRCEVVSQFPEPRTLTDRQVANLLIQLHQNNVNCRNSMRAIRQFLEDTKTRLEAE